MCIVGTDLSFCCSVCTLHSIMGLQCIMGMPCIMGIQCFVGTNFTDAMHYGYNCITFIHCIMGTQPAVFFPLLHIYITPAPCGYFIGLLLSFISSRHQVHYSPTLQSYNLISSYSTDVWTFHEPQTPVGYTFNNIALSHHTPVGFHS